MTQDTITTGQLPPRSSHFAFLFCALAICLVLNPLAHWQGRFWAEEGTDFFQNLRNADILGVFGYVYKGTLQIGSNIATWSAAHISVRQAPLITTWIGTAFILNFSILFSAWARECGVRPRLALAGLGLFLLSGASYEVLSNSTNLQWLCSFSMLLIAMLPGEVLGRRRVYVIGFTILSGLSGVPSCMLAPVLALRAVVLRSWLHFVLAAILGLCALGQLALILGADTGPRSFSYNAAETLYAAIVRPVLALALSSKGAGIIMGLAHDALPFALLLVAAVAAMTVGAFGLLRARTADQFRTDVAPLLLAWLLVTSLNVYGSLADGSDAVRGIGGDRYYLLGSLCFILLLLQLAGLRRPIAHLVAIALGGMLTVNLAYALLTRSPVKYNHVPGWQAQIDRCKRDAQPDCTLAIWPNQPDESKWSVTIAKDDL